MTGNYYSVIAAFNGGVVFVGKSCEGSFFKMFNNWSGWHQWILITLINNLVFLWVALQQHVLFCNFFLLRSAAQRQTGRMIRVHIRSQISCFHLHPGRQMKLSEESTLLLSDLMKPQLIASDSPAWKTPEQQEISSCAAQISWYRTEDLSERGLIVAWWLTTDRLYYYNQFTSVFPRQPEFYWSWCSVNMNISIKVQDMT